MSFLQRLFPQRSANYALLRQLTNQVGVEVERWPVEDLRRPPEHQTPLTRALPHATAEWLVDCYKEEHDGTLHVSVDCWSSLPTPLGVKPSYHFQRLPDGTIRY